MKALRHLVKSSLPYKLYRQSVGNWLYPFLVFGWVVASIFNRPRKVNHNGVKFNLPCDNWITHFRWYLFGRKEAEVVKFLDEYCDNSDILFDIGANIGIYSIYACKKYSGLKVWCFEPEFSNLHYLKMNVFNNKLQDRITISSIAAGNRNQVSTLHIQDLTPGAAVHTESETNIEKTADGYDVIWRECISVATLDALATSLGVQPTVLKIDTDGNEQKVLEGAQELLTSGPLHSIIIERPNNDETRRACMEILSRNGFDLKLDDPEIPNQVWSRS